MPHLFSARTYPTSTATIGVALTLAEERDNIWCYLFEQALPPFDLSDHVLVHGTPNNGRVYAELRPEATEETVLRTLDWLSDAVDATDQAHVQYLSAVEQAKQVTERWYRTQL